MLPCQTPTTPNVDAVLQVITETTIANNNRSLWDRLSPRTLLDWVRNMVANRLASSGREWMELYALHNSGT